MSDRRIVERLRQWPLSEKLATEAAARIEALEAALREIAELKIKVHSSGVPQEIARAALEQDK